MILIDTNVLVYAINTDALQHSSSIALIEAVRAKQIKGVLVPQVLLEFFAIVTDHRRVEKPLEPKVAWEQAEAFRSILPVFDAGLKGLDFLKDEIQNNKKILGSDIFDAYLVAQMRAINISVLCTYNTKDFTGYEGIIAQKPDELSGREFE